MSAQDCEHIRSAVQVAKNARDHGNHPFGAILVDGSGKQVLSAENSVVTERDATGHAETNLVRLATKTYDSSFLSTCSLYTSTEPCAMCSGAIYWSGIKRVVYCFPEDKLYEITGCNPENPTLRLPCRQVFECGQTNVVVEGPILEEEGRVVHEGFWTNH
eukprot:GILJ01003292.1.p1 GENE.GILJ01003292.1~~GILJ01003292.1.p1  ORF type:complete len:175 (+),score=9.01 GILJ01003292.1:48-527(+)